MVEVGKAGYDACSSANNVSAFRSGNDVVALTAVGTRYFLCGLTSPFFDLFFSMMRVYGFHLLDFVTNAMVCMAIFAHLCDNFIGVSPPWTCSGTSSYHGLKTNLTARET